MRFHGVNMIGEFKAETVVDASALIWAPTDERRIVFDETSKELWIADSSQWKNYSAYGDIPVATEMWFYADSAPNSWTLVALAGDDLLAVKGGGTYTTGGTQQGAWATPAHSHNMNSHDHVMSGTATANPPNGGQERGGNLLGADQDHIHSLSISVGNASPASTTSGGSSSSYRPDSRVGIICSKD